MTRKEIPDFELRLNRANNAIQEYGLRVAHIRNEDVEMTIVYRIPWARMNIAEFATSICHPGEQFDRGVGRTIAVERFVEGQTVQMPVWMLDV